MIHRGRGIGISADKEEENARIERGRRADVRRGRKTTAIQVKMTEKLHNVQNVYSRKRQMVIYGLTVMDFTEKMEKIKEMPCKIRKS